MTEVININNVCKKLGNKLVNDNISLHVNKGEFYCLAGPNGSGKSTLLRQIIGLEKSDSGTITIEGYNVLKEHTKLSNVISYQPQNVSSLLRGLKVKEGLYYIGLLKKISKNECKKEINRLLQLFQIEYLKNTIIEKLSGGERQIINLCMTFLGKNPIMFFDEPTNNLDAMKKEIIINEMIRCRNEYNSTIFLITHELMEFEKIIDRISIISEGKIIVTDIPYMLCKESNDMIKINFKNLKGELKEKLLSQYRLLKENEYISFLVNNKDIPIILNQCSEQFNMGLQINLSSINLQDKYFYVINQNKGDKKDA